MTRRNFLSTCLIGGIAGIFGGAAKVLGQDKTEKPGWVVTTSVIVDPYFTRAELPYSRFYTPHMKSVGFPTRTSYDLESR